MDISLLLSFIAASALLTLMPGPDILFVLTESVAKGSGSGIAVATGLVSGLLVHTTAVATGLSLLVKNSPSLFAAISYLGAAYLLWLALSALKEQQPRVDDIQTQGAPFNFLRYYKTGFLMNVLNPKVAIFFLAFFPQFIDPSATSPVLHIYFLGIIFMAQAYLIFAGVALLAGRTTQLLRTARFWNLLKWSKIVVLLLLAFLVAFR